MDSFSKYCVLFVFTENRLDVLEYLYLELKFTKDNLISCEDFHDAMTSTLHRKHYRMIEWLIEILKFSKEELEKISGKIIQPY